MVNSRYKVVKVNSGRLVKNLFQAVIPEALSRESILFK